MKRVCHMEIVRPKNQQQQPYENHFCSELQPFELLHNSHGKIGVLLFNHQSTISRAKDTHTKKNRDTFTEVYTSMMVNHFSLILPIQQLPVKTIIDKL